MKKKTSLLLSGLASFLMLGCASHRTSHVHTKLQTHEIEDTIHDGVTTKNDVIRRFGSRCTIERDGDGREMWVYHLAVPVPTLVKSIHSGIQVGGANMNYHYNPKDQSQPHFASKSRGFTPEYETKNYTFTLYMNEDGKVISHHLIPSESKKVPSWERYNRDLAKHL
ncbi:MAG: hypothetical protein KDK71_09645 [Chlamydiia bacterium]|nr:hypothetical protein [Chlamydiia bacterium]